MVSVSCSHARFWSFICHLVFLLYVTNFMVFRSSHTCHSLSQVSAKAGMSRSPPERVGMGGEGVRGQAGAKVQPARSCACGGGGGRLSACAGAVECVARASLAPCSGLGARLIMACYVIMCSRARPGRWHSLSMRQAAGA